MVSFENFVKSMPPSLSESKVTPSFCFPFKIPDDPTATIGYKSLRKVANFQIHAVFLRMREIILPKIEITKFEIGYRVINIILLHISHSMC